jgi:hypothetical protein
VDHDDNRREALAERTTKMSGIIAKEPAWLLAKVDQRLALMREKLGDEGITLLGLADVVITPLTEPPENATQQQIATWDKSCDNCGRLCPTRLVTGQVVRMLDKIQVTFFFGACPRCAGVKA